MIMRAGKRHPKSTHRINMYRMAVNAMKVCRISVRYGLTLYKLAVKNKITKLLPPHLSVGGTIC